MDQPSDIAIYAIIDQPVALQARPDQPRAARWAGAEWVDLSAAAVATMNMAYAPMEWREFQAAYPNALAPLAEWRSGSLPTT